MSDNQREVLIILYLAQVNAVQAVLSINIIRTCGYVEFWWKGTDVAEKEKSGDVKRLLDAE